MTTNTNLTKVLEYLIKNDEEKARELLHRVFIEKARAIHEELMGADEDSEEEIDETTDEADCGDEELDETVDELDEVFGGSGDQGQDLTRDISSMNDRVESEETMAMEAGDDDVEVDAEISPMDADVAPEGDTEVPTMTDIEVSMDGLEAALQQLKAQFDQMNGGEDEDEVVDTDVMPSQVPGMDSGDEVEADESWELDEDFDDLAESLDLEIIEKDMLKTNKTAKDVGSASSGMATGNDAKSTFAKSQTSKNGASPVKTGEGPTESGYNAKTAPTSKDQGLGDNRRKKSTEGTSKVTAPKNSEDSGVNKTSPLSKGGSMLKQ